MRMMIVALVAVLGTGCGATVRNTDTLKAEVNFTNNLVKSEAQAIEELMKMHCACEDGKWTTTWCHNAADVYAVYIDRWEWHYKMTRHLSFDEERPEDKPPAMRTADQMCALFESSEGSE